MQYQSFGFIGGGRITRIILTALKKTGKLSKTVFVSDANPDVLANLKKDFPAVSDAGNDNGKPAACDVVFVSLHPPVMSEALGKVKSSIRTDAIIVSLAPKLSISMLSNILGGHEKIVRMIPNAPSIINKGYNPVAFSKGISTGEKSELIHLFGEMGDCPEVPEENLEAYAIIAAMGPTYFWFQWQTLSELARSFGLTDEAIREALAKMVKGAADTMFSSSLSPSEVMDLVPVKPLAEDEETIRSMYTTKLTALYGKLKS
ncbi:MAG TPA: NAD(P)-binding domain-containing protein [Syntrophorhabdus sp.]|nr:NAD(P)-binding domain-containing protein [Syntrophorhabdus sp.]